MGAMNTIGKNIYEGIKPSGATSIQGWNSTKGLFAELIERVRPATIIEVGTWLGASAIHMAGLCRSLGLPHRQLFVDDLVGELEHRLSIRRGEDRPSSGCTVMTRTNLIKVIGWLREDRNPHYAILPQAEYDRYREAWGLPAFR
jgi:hypothetical protein